jgi:hypothetical protein
MGSRKSIFTGAVRARWAAAARRTSRTSEARCSISSASDASDDPRGVGSRQRAEQPLQVRERQATADDDQLVAPSTAKVARIEHRPELVPERTCRSLDARRNASWGGGPADSRPPKGPEAPGARDRQPPTFGGTPALGHRLRFRCSQ